MSDRRVAFSDLGLAALLGVFALVGTGPAAAKQGLAAPPLSYALAVGASLPIALRRWRPWWSFALVGAATMVYLALGYAYGPIMVTLAVALYGLAVRCPPRQALLGMALLFAASVVAVGVGAVTGPRSWLELISVSAWLVIPAATGMAVKARRDATAQVRAAQVRRALSEERLQLAREVHDIVGHGLAVIAMQAGVALRVLDRDPQRARAALEAIRATSREALDGLRAELEELRGRPEQPAAPLRPGVGLADLPGLVERIRSGGLPVTLAVDEDLPAVPAEAQRAAYRIVQEALTNVLRHAGPRATARVRVARDPRGVLVEVVDTGLGAAAPQGRGAGVEGMRARAEALGGSLAAGPEPGGGFAVRAHLPVGQRAALSGEAQ